jgi:MHS family proline/betaine transporter-like MFS transporter
MSKEIKRVLISGMIGNALEWYDFVLFIQFAPFISQLFFPANNKEAALLSTLGIFAAGFVMRPVGGILFGYLGDKFGRKVSLVFSILMMSIPTAMIGILPVYSQIGILSPILLTVIRLLQGIALGGGFSGCMAFLVEHAPANQRGLIGSASMFSLGAGVLFGIIVSLIISSSMDKASFKEWGWRLPFIASIFIGMVAFYIKKYVHESPVYLNAKKSGTLSKEPVRDVIKHHKKTLLIAIGIYLTVTVPFYTLSAYFNTFLQNKMDFTLQETMKMNGIAMIFFMIAIPISGYFSDKIGRKKVLSYAAIALAIAVYPVFCLVTSGSSLLTIYGQMIFAVIVGCYVGPTPATLVELFPTSVRFSGLALSYNISAAIFGGTVPLVYSQLIKYTDSYKTPAFYILFFILVTGYSIYKFKDKYNKSLV